MLSKITQLLATEGPVGQFVLLTSRRLWMSTTAFLYWASQSSVTSDFSVSSYAILSKAALRTNAHGTWSSKFLVLVIGPFPLRWFLKELSLKPSWLLFDA